MLLPRQGRPGEGTRADVRLVALDEGGVHVHELEDPRSTINQRHPLARVLVIALVAVLAGAAGPTAIARRAALKEEVRSQVLALPNGIPRKDVSRRVRMALKPAAFQARFANRLRSLRTAAVAGTGVEQPTSAVDGQSLRRRHDREEGLGALRSVGVGASEYGLSLGRVAGAEQSNAITAIPALLRRVDITGAIIALDAMGTQKAIAEQIVPGGADDVPALKGNQEALPPAVITYSDEQREGDLSAAQEHLTTETGDGREETRTDLQSPAPEDRPGSLQWKGLKAIGRTTSCFLRDGKETLERRSDISSPGVEVARFARAVRGHWRIANTCHWSLGMRCREDEWRIRERHLRENFAWRNRFVLSLLKQHSGRQSLVRKRRSCGGSDAFLMEVVAGSTR